MDSLCHILCVSCYRKVGKDQDVLLCGNCLLWQHRECSTDVPERFYQDFYLAVIQNEKPLPWTCHYCTKHETRVKPEVVSPVRDQAMNKSNLQLPPRPQTPGSDESLYSESSFDEFNYAMDSEAREGPANNLNEKVGTLDGSQDLSHIYSTDTGSRGWQSDDSDSGDEVYSHINSTTPPTPFHTPRAKLSTAAPSRCAGFCSGTTDDDSTDDDITPTIIIQRSQQHTIDPESREAMTTSFTSDSEVSTNADLYLSSLCNKLSYMSDSSDDSEDDQYPTTSPTGTPPYTDGSDNSSDSEDDVSMAIRYTVTEGTMSGARALLSDSLGYTYNIKFKLGVKMFWCCTEKSKRCQATIIQSRKVNFTRGVASHNHIPSQSKDCPSCSVQPARPVSQSLSQSSKTTVSLERAAPVSKQPVKMTKQPSVTRTIEDSTAYMELDSCDLHPARPKSLLVDSAGYIYRKKIVHRPMYSDHDITIWKCTHIGTLEKCKASIQINDTIDFNTDPHREQHIYGVNLDDKLVRATDMHNHEGDKYQVGKAIIKTAIKEQVFALGGHSRHTREVIEDAYKSLHQEDKQMILITSNAWWSAFTSFTYNQQRIYKKTPLDELDKFYI